MRLPVSAVSALIGAFAWSVAAADLPDETFSVERLGEPQPSWFLINDDLGRALLFDAASGRMLGMLSGSPLTTTTEASTQRGELYQAATFYSRGTYGDRTEVLLINDLATLSPKAEVPIPHRMASGVPVRGYTGLLDGDRLLGIYNQTPGSSVSVVDLEARALSGEIDTSGCGLVLPAGERTFLQICGDGTLQRVDLDDAGKESARSRSKRFFDVEKDALTDKPARTADGWLFVTAEGQTFAATLDGDGVDVQERFRLVDSTDPVRFRIGGHQHLAVLRDTNVAIALMHEGGVDTHKAAGTEAWFFDINSGRRIHRIKLERPGDLVNVTSGDDVRLLIGVTGSPEVDVYDIRTGVRQRSMHAGTYGPALLSRLDE